MTAMVLEDRMQAIYETHSGALQRTLLVWTYGDWQAAEDLMQETMLRAWRNLGKLNSDPQALGPWLFAVARRVAVDRFRARVVRPKESAPDQLERVCAPEEPYEQLLARDMIRGALAGLSEAHRAVLVHVYLLDQTIPETAAALGLPEGTVKSRVHYALRAVREALDTAA
jgi:RNA polymerase sigma-70 factor, ECF subfamily